MKKILEKIKGYLNGEYGGLIILFILELILTITIKPIRYDDAFYIKQFGANTIIDFIHHRYLTWTSRVLIETTLGLIFKISGYVWVFGQIFIMTLIGYSISKLFVKENKRQMNFMILWMLMLYPVERMAGAGWAATTVNYAWPLAMGMFSLISIRKMWDKEKIKVIPGILYVLSLIYSCNQELCCGVLLVTYVMFAIILTIRDKKKVNIFIYVQVLITILSIIFILTTPGNAIRKLDETVGYFPDYYSLSIIEKFSTGITATIGEMIANYSITFAVFTGIIAVYVYTNYKDKFVKAIGLVPFVFTMIFSYLNAVTNNIYVIKLIRENFLVEKVLIIPQNFNYIGSYINLIISLIIIVSIFANLLLIFKNIKRSIAFYVFGVGLVTRLTLAFSPTIFISQNRTFIIMEIADLICTILIWQEFEKTADKKLKSKIYNTIVFLAIVEYLISLSFVLVTHVEL